MIAPVQVWFRSEICYWKSLASTIWSIIWLPAFMVLFLILAQFSVTHPVQWLFGVWMSVISLQFWVSWIVCSMCLLMVTYFSLSHFSVVPEVGMTQLRSFLALFRWSRLSLMVVCSLAGAMTAWSLLSLMGEDFESVTRILSSELHVQVVILNEWHLFVVLLGLFTGFSYYKQFFQHQHYYLAFSTVQRLKWFQMRGEISRLIQSCLWHSLHTLKYFYLLYLFLGEFPKSWIQHFFSINASSDDTPLNSLAGLMNLKLLWQSYMCSVMLLLIWSTTRAWMKICHTEHLELPISSLMEQDKQRTLPEALKCSDCPLLQHLAFMDLHIVSKYMQSRRQEILSLSQPGGHPKIWTSVCNSAVGLVRELCEHVKEDNWAIMSEVSLCMQRSEVHSAYNSYTGEAKSFLYHRYATDSQTAEAETEQQTHKSATLLTKLHDIVVNLPLLSSCLNETNDVLSGKLFASCQLHIWAVQALSQMASKAYIEDKYGVVQSTLPTIIATLLDLYEAVEKHFKLTTSVIRRPMGTSDYSSSALLLRYKLHSANKASIYLIVNTYRQHIQDLRLSPDHFKRLQPFIGYTV